MNTTTLKFKRMGDAKLLKFGFSVVDSQKGNANFPDTTLLQAAEKALQEFQVSLSDASSGDRTKIEIKNNKRLVLEQALSDLADYVSHVSKGDRAILLSSGFTLNKESGSRRTVSAIEGIVVETKRSGEATTSVKSVAGAKAYAHQYTTEAPTPETVWVSEMTTLRKHTFTGLEPGVNHWFRVMAIGSGGQKEYSDAVSRIIQ